MSEEDVNGLSGRWSGIFEYPDPDRPAVAFSVDLVEEASVLAGRVEEPNSFYLGGPDMLQARLHGERDDTTITFSKTYEVDGLIFRLVQYQGYADAALSRVEGRWWILGPGGSSGRFEMMRAVNVVDPAAAGSAKAT